MAGWRTRHISLGAALVVSALGCAKFQEPVKKIQSLAKRDPSPLNSLQSPLGFSGLLNSPKDKAEAEKLNATYFFLTAQRKSYEGHSDEALVALERAKALDQDSSLLHYSLAQEYLKKGLSSEGVAYAQKALELDPHNRDAKLLLANLYATAKKFTEARKLFAELMAQDANDEETLLYAVLLELEQKHTALAFEKLENYLKRNPESALGFFYLGRLQQEQRQNAKAVRSFERAVEIRPGFVQAGTYLATLYEDLGEKAKALQTYAWLALQTDGAAFHKKLGELYLMNKEYEKALGSFQNFERLDGGDLNNKLKIALLLTELKRLDEAGVVFQNVLRESPESDNVRFYLASVFDQQGKGELAAREFVRIPFKSKLYPEALRYLVNYYRKNRQSDAADDLLVKAGQQVEKEKSHVDEVREIRLTHWDSTGRGNAALEEIESILKKNPAEQRYLYLKGSVLERAGRPDEAIRSMQAILRKDPMHAGALNFIGFLWTEKGTNLAQAETYIRRALVLRPEDPFITDSLGWVLFKRAKYPEALSALEKAHADRPDEAIIADHLGDVLVKMGRFSEAKAYYEKALKLGPDKEQDRKKLEVKLRSLETVSSHVADGHAPELLDAKGRQPSSSR